MAADTFHKSDASTFSIEIVLSRTWKVLFKNPIVFLGLTVLLFALIEIVRYGMHFLIPEIAQRYSEFLYIFIAMLLRQWIGGAIAYGVYQTLKGKGVSLADSLSHGMKRFAPLIFVGALEVLGISLGLKLFVIPAIFMVCIWIVAIPVCVVERLGAIKSLFRSMELTKGCWIKIFALYFLIVRITVQAVERSVAFVMPVEMEATILSFIPRIASWIPEAFGLVMVAVIYFELRNIKEGIAVDSLANVFD